VHVIKYDAWWILDFDFVHAQLAVIVSVLLVSGVILFPLTLANGAVLTMLVITLCYHLFLIAPFTRLYKKQVLESTNPLRENSNRLMLCNVYQDNTEYDRLIKLVQHGKPDVLLLVETNTHWAKALSVLEDDFKYKVSCHLENT